MSFKQKEEEEEDYISEKRDPTKFDVVLEMAGSWGVWQKVMCVVISVSQVVTASNNVAAVFLSASLSHRCKLPLEEGSTNYSQLLNNISYPSINSNCLIFNHNYSGIASYLSDSGRDIGVRDLSPFLSNETIKCHEWSYESDYYQTTAVSEWNLVCSRKLLRATTQATYMAGILIGSLVFGQISDKIGRRPTMLFCTVCLFVFSIGVFFANSYITFIALRFCVALLCSGFMVCNFVLLMEITKPEARSFTGMLNGIPFGLGVSSVALLAYFFREWKTLQLALAGFSSIYLIYFWILPESPRWLASKGRYEECLHILKNIAKWNKKVLPKDEEILLLLKEFSDPEVETEKSVVAQCYSFIGNPIILVRTPIMRRRCLISFFVWFVSSMVYYGLIFSSANIRANPYLMVIVSGLLETPAFCITAVLIYRFGRRIISCLLLVICSIFLLTLIGIPDDQVVVTFTLANLGKFFATAVFQLFYLYTSELVPTGVRNIAVGTSSMFARIGSSIAPYIIDILGEVHYTVPLIVFGGLSMTAGLLAFLLPETINKPLPQTIEEVEAKTK